MHKTSFSETLNQHAQIFESISSTQIETLIAKIQSQYHKGKIIGLAAGRMGYSLKSYIMRLSHLGFDAYMIGDTTLPRIGSKDVVIINSSSGNTPTMQLYAEQAKTVGAYVILLTAQHDSNISKISDLTVLYQVSENNHLMKSIYEQFSFLFLDYLAHILASKSEMTIEQIEQNHSILE